MNACCSALTNVVNNNGFNPVRQEAVSLGYDVVSDMRNIVFVRFEMCDEMGLESRPLAGCLINLGSAQLGACSLCLPRP